METKKLTILAVSETIMEAIKYHKLDNDLLESHTYKRVEGEIGENKCIGNQIYIKFPYDINSKEGESFYHKLVQKIILKLDKLENDYPNEIEEPIWEIILLPDDNNKHKGITNILHIDIDIILKEKF